MSAFGVQHPMECDTSAALLTRFAFVVLQRPSRCRHDDQYRACLFTHAASVEHVVCARLWNGTANAVGVARTNAFLASSMAMYIPRTLMRHACAPACASAQDPADCKP